MLALFTMAGFSALTTMLSTLTGLSALTMFAATLTGLAVFGVLTTLTSLATLSPLSTFCVLTTCFNGRTLGVADRLMFASFLSMARLACSFGVPLRFASATGQQKGQRQRCDDGEKPTGRPAHSLKSPGLLWV
ncbi:hypothetical protein ACFL3Z_00155 [Gemmatimonadota bacterium]